MDMGFMCDEEECIQPKGARIDTNAITISDCD